VREQRSKDYNGWGDGYGGGGGGDGSGSQRHNFRVEQTRVKIMQKWEGGVFSQRRGLATLQPSLSAKPIQRA
jgi:hypothetical protein